MNDQYYDLYNKIAHVSGLCIDSRKVKNGQCFFALKSNTFDANTFINNALNNGAEFAVTSDKSIVSQNILYAADVTQALGYCAKKFYQNLPEYKIAVTGTNGKTSTVDYCRQLLVMLGKDAASLGTIGLVSNKALLENFDNIAQLTSNDLITNYQILQGLKQVGIDYVALEASSIGIEQNRFNKIEFSVAAFTSFSQDHLDYHGSMQRYLAAKLELFKRNMLTNSDIWLSHQVYQQIMQLCPGDMPQKYKLIGDDDCCDFKIYSHISDLNGQQISFKYREKLYSFTSQIIGSFQGYNLIFAIAICHSLGFDLQQILRFIPLIKPVRGRLEKIHHQTKYIFVDYAHNPAGLENVLLELSALKGQNSKLITLFGCGGDRDKSKRSLMGRIATELADFVIITDDNPRNEDPKQIIQDICAGIDKKNYKIIQNRQDAIIYGLNIMSNYDIMLIAGKGHEEYQTYGQIKIYFSDINVVNQYINTKNDKHLE